MKSRYALLTFITLLFLLFLTACAGMAPTKEVRTIDSLNILAYNYRYKDLDSSFYYADRAFNKASIYTQGKAEASNNLAFCSFIAMDFDKAEYLYKAVYSLTKNELECLIADVGLMKIYQRVAENKLYYDYRNSALRRMKRIREDSTVFTDKHEIIRLNYAFSEFYIVSAIYYYYQQQQLEALLSLDQIDQNSFFKKDTNQYLYYHYIKGTAELFSSRNSNQRRLASFDQLYEVYLTASAGNYLYFIGNSLQGLADLMSSPGDYNFFTSRRYDALMHLDEPVDSLLPLRLGQRALSAFTQYGDIYQIASAQVSISRFLNYKGDYAEALDSLSRALDYVNFHHAQYYHGDSLHNDALKVYSPIDSSYNETHWLNQEKARSVPEWIARIREQLSVSYAGLDKKTESDYNRNIYLDILNDTRQDKELESRYNYLTDESNMLTAILFILAIVFISIIVFFFFFNRRSQKRNQGYLTRLRQTLSLCKDITSSIPMDFGLVQSGLDKLFGDNNVTLSTTEDEVVRLEVKAKLNKEERFLVNVLSPYIEWAVDNENTIALLSEERSQLEKKRYLYEQHITANKRENTIKKARLFIVNGITPYIDRILNETHKLLAKGYIDNEEIKRDKYQYIDELVSIINEYNEILALWIKMKQGKLSLNIENFSLNELFDLIAKGRRTFEMKKLNLKIDSTDVWLKADKALTLFMINTLVDNARKYTPEGGEVHLYATKNENYVEISIKDTGYGLSQEDIARILDEKVYDSRTIGVKNAPDAAALLLNKGNGFGLMNCKGIIDKYRKTNAIYNVSVFKIDSVPGKGSRFYFRLPLGLKRLYSIVVIMLGLSSLFTSCIDSIKHDNPMLQLPDSLREHTNDSIYDKWLIKASDFANATYYGNINHQYIDALKNADSAIFYLNKHMAEYSSVQLSPLQLIGYDLPAEIDWWNKDFDTDFHIILDVRNEAAIAYLALKSLEGYKYNNDAYTALYKLQSEDHSLEAYCIDIERSSINKTIGIIIIVILLVILFVGYYFLLLRKRLVNQDNLRQMLEINKRIFSSSVLRISEEDEALLREEETLKAIPQHIINDSFDAIDELFDVQTIGLAVYNSSSHHLTYAETPLSDTMPEVVQVCFDRSIIIDEADSITVPLIVDTGEEHSCVGVFYMSREGGFKTNSDRLLVELLARYISIVVFNAIVKPATKYRDIESAHEEAQKASWEEGILHVQNMVLDNCLSTIKHETIYYPNKIKQIIKRLNEVSLTHAEEHESVLAISELISYYKGVFTILSSCASRQLEEVTFRRSTIWVTTLFNDAEKYFKKQTKNDTSEITLTIVPFEGKVVGDIILMRFLVESLINEALSYKQKGELKFSAVADGEFVRFTFTDTRRNKSQLELNNLFYPNLANMTTDDKNELKGTEYLICKQIIRDHDEFAGRRGCRIYAETNLEGGFNLHFTLPLRR